MLLDKVNLVKHLIMEAVQNSEELHQYIAVIKDNFENDIDVARKKIVQFERTKYLNEEGKSFTHDQVKEMALNKALRRGFIRTGK